MVAPLTKSPRALKAWATQRVFYGWWIAVAGMISNFFSAGTFYYGFGAFFNPIIDEFHWSRTALSGAFSIQQGESGTVAPFVGWVVDKFGPRRTMVAGTIVTGAGFVSMAFTHSLWQFYASMLLMAIGSSFGGFIVIVTTVNNWFVYKRGRAMALMTTGAGLAGMLVTLVAMLIDAVGWRHALLAVGIGTWAVGIPTSLVMRGRPEDYGMQPDGMGPDAGGAGSPGRRQGGRAHAPEGAFTVRAALHSPVFWLFGLSAGLGGIASSAISVHLIPAEVNAGISRETAATAVMALTLFSLVGRWTGGVAGDYIDRRFVLAAAFTLETAGMLLLAFASDYWHFLLGLVLFAPGFGATVPTRWAMLADYFGRRSFGSLMGILVTLTTAMGIAGPIFAGWMFDMQETYRVGFLMLAAITLPAVPLVLTLKRPAPVTAATSAR